MDSITHKHALSTDRMIQWDYKKILMDVEKVTTWRKGVNIRLTANPTHIHADRNTQKLSDQEEGLS